jgi:hypothetical protein
MGFSSGNSCYKCIFMVLCRIFLPKKTNHRPWCGGDTCALSWGVIGPQAMVWAEAAVHLSDLWYKAKVSLGAKRVSRQEVSSVALNSHKISYD